MSTGYDEQPVVGVMLGGKPFRLTLQYPGDIYYPSGAWYDLPELVAHIKSRQVLRYRSESTRPTWSLTVAELRKFHSSPDITHLRDNRKELEKLKNGEK